MGIIYWSGEAEDKFQLMLIYMVTFTLGGLSSFLLLGVMANQKFHQIEIQANRNLLSNYTNTGARYSFWAPVC